MNRLLDILKKEFIQMRRDSVTLAIMLIMPVMQLIIFGFAINTDVKHLLSSFAASEYFDMVFVEDSFEGVNTKIDSGDAKVGIIIPPDLEENLKHGRSTPVQVIVDASDSQSAASAVAAAQSIGMLKSQEALLETSGTHRPETALYDIRIRAWYNPDFVTAFYMVPAIMGTILTMTMVLCLPLWAQF